MSVTWGTPVGANLFWGDLTVVGDHGVSRGDLILTSLDGWEDLPDGRASFEARPNGHGTFDAPVWSGARTVRAMVASRDRARRDEMYRLVKRSLVFASRPEEGLRPLTVQFAGESLTVDARLVWSKTDINNYAVGLFGFAAEWVAPDPLRYGPEEVVETGLPTSGGGLKFELFGNPAGVLDFGPVPEDGIITLTNEGSADTHPVFEVVGNLPGFSLTETTTGNRIEFVGDIPPSSVLTLDPATGIATLDGVADRSGRLVRREWVPVPAGGVSRWLFASSRYDTAAKLTAKVKAAYW